jgi:hypothetical protein
MRFRLFWMLGVSVLIQNPGYAQSQISRITPPDNCEVVGRILSSGERRYTRGSIVCKGEKVTPLPGKRVSFLCERDGSPRVISGFPTNVDDCGTRPPEAFPCTGNPLNRCVKLKGQITAKLLRPASELLLNPRPRIQWKPVEGANRYQVELSGVRQQWSRSTTTTSLDYPTEQPLQPGQTYQISLVAFKDNQPIQSDQMAITIVSSDVGLPLRLRLQELYAIALPKTERILSEENILASYGLISESIALLEQLSSTDPSLRVLSRLGDRLAQVGRYQEAESAYGMAKRFARHNFEVETLTNRIANLTVLPRQ